MDSSCKRRGFFKAKLGLPFYKAAKLTASGVHQQINKVTQREPSPSDAATTVTLMVHQDNVISSQPKQKVSFILPDCDSLGQFDKIFQVAGDESVDFKATNYISSVRERFKLERLNSERKKTEDVY